MITFLSAQDLFAFNFSPVFGSKNPKEVIGLSPFNISITATIKSLFSLILLSIFNCLIQESYSILVTLAFILSIHVLFLYTIIVKFKLENLEIWFNA